MWMDEGIRIMWLLNKGRKQFLLNPVNGGFLCHLLLFELIPACLKSPCIWSSVLVEHVNKQIKIELYISSSLFVTNTYPGDNCLSLLYDCSSADIDPIGSISKMDLRTFQKWASVHLGYSSLAEIEAPPPTAEVEPICWNYSQVSDSVCCLFSVCNAFSSVAGAHCFLFLVFFSSFTLESSHFALKISTTSLNAWGLVMKKWSTAIKTLCTTIFAKQLDEGDIGMIFDEHSVSGRLRSFFCCGPVSMFKVCPLHSVRLLEYASY